MEVSRAPQDLKGVTVGVLFCAELLRFSRENKPLIGCDKGLSPCILLCAGSVAQSVHILPCSLLLRIPTSVIADMHIVDQEGTSLGPQPGYPTVTDSSGFLMRTSDSRNTTRNGNNGASDS